MLIKVVAVQSEVGQPLTLEEKIYIFKQRPDFVCFPEYAMITPEEPDFHRAALKTHQHLDYFTRLSTDLSTCLVAGSVVEPDGDRLYNTSYLINRGNLLGRYRKMHPVEGELNQGISAGEKIAVFNIEGTIVGLMICGDVFYPARYEALAAHGADVIFIPTTSPYRADDTPGQKRRRDEQYFISGARSAGAYVTKVSSVGQLFGRPLQGRSSIAAPWGLLTQTEFEAEQQKRILSVTLDIDEVREFRRKRQRKAAVSVSSERSAG
ncbi:hypothetical protein GF420_08520 [candidate division GN15 bacterium]|nr:hypothetical protein [candidate division GN15 bacterium]